MSFFLFEFRDDCKNLPEKYSLKGISADYNKFTEDASLYFKKELNLILINNRKLIVRDNDYDHVITRKRQDLKGKEDRLPDYERIRRISWIKYILKNCYKDQCNSIREWIKLEPSRKRNRLHIMCDDIGYIIVLEEYKDIYFIISAFCIDNNKHYYYLQEYKKYGH